MCASHWQILQTFQYVRVYMQVNCTFHKITSRFQIGDSQWPNIGNRIALIVPIVARENRNCGEAEVYNPGEYATDAIESNVRISLKFFFSRLFKREQFPKIFLIEKCRVRVMIHGLEWRQSQSLWGAMTGKRRKLDERKCIDLTQKKETKGRKKSSRIND